MPKNEGVNISIGADMTDLEAALAKMPGQTEESARKMVQALARQMNRIPKDAEQAAAKTASSWNQHMGTVRKALAGVGGQLGSLGGRAANLVEVAAGFGAMGLAIAGVAAVATAGAAGIAAMALSADELADSQAHLVGLPGFEPIRPDALRAARELDAGIAAIEETAKRLISQAGAAWALALKGPFEEATLSVIQFGLALERYQTGEDLSVWVIPKLRDEARALMLQMIALDEVERIEKPAAEASAKAKQAQADATRRASEALREELAQQRSAAEFTRLWDAATGDLASTYDRINTTYDEQIAKLYELQSAAGSYIKSNQMAAALAEVEARRSRDMWAEKKKDEEEWVKRQEAAEDAGIEAGLADQQRREDRKQAERDYWTSTTTMGFQAAASLAQAMADSAEDGSDAQRRAAMVAFRANQATSIASIGMSTAEAIMKAIAIFGPPPSPAGIAAIGAAGVIGATEAAAVMAQSPPSFHVGGLVSTSSYAPDELKITRPEVRGILSGQGVNTLGRDRINAANRGESDPQAFVIEARYGHRLLDAQLANAVRMPGSSLRKALKGTARGRVGRRTR